MAKFPRGKNQRRRICGFGTTTPCPFIWGLECVQGTEMQKKIMKYMKKWSVVDGVPQFYRLPPKDRKNPNHNCPHA